MARFSEPIESAASAITDAEDNASLSSVEILEVEEPGAAANLPLTPPTTPSREIWTARFSIQIRLVEGASNPTRDPQDIDYNRYPNCHRSWAVESCHFFPEIRAGLEGIALACSGLPRLVNPDGLLSRTVHCGLCLSNTATADFLRHILNHTRRGSNATIQLGYSEDPVSPVARIFLANELACRENTSEDDDDHVPHTCYILPARLVLSKYCRVNIFYGKIIT